MVPGYFHGVRFSIIVPATPVMLRKTKRRIVIPHRHPFHTSGRKVDLYSPWETLWMLTRVVVTGGQSLMSPEATRLWYDGRR